MSDLVPTYPSLRSDTPNKSGTHNNELLTSATIHPDLSPTDLDIAQDALLFGEEFVLDSHMSHNMETLLDSDYQPLVCPHLSDPPLYSDIPECVLTPPPASQSVPINDTKYKESISSEISCSRTS